MNRPSNTPPNMSRHLHGHHNMRAPPPSIQPVAPTHGLPPMGYPPPPPTLSSVQQRPPRVQQQHSYHAFMDSNNASAGASFVHHYNRMGGGNQGPKKYHQLNKPRIPKSSVDNARQHQHPQPHQVLQHPSSNLPTNSSATVVPCYKIQNDTRQPLHQTQSLDSSSYPANTKKISEKPRQFEPNYQQTIVTSGGAVPPTTESAKRDDLQNKEGGAVDSDIVCTKGSDGPPKEVSPQSGDDNTISLKDAAVENSATEKDDKNEESLDSADSTNKENDAVFKSSREKTPMCLVNDLARFNKISFQYRLTGENGPAHCKRFTVTLKLGDEEYMAEGLKIKEAQHLAAKEAIRRTKYKHPIPKTNRRNEEQGASRVNVTPTVELNALAMKLGLQTYYIFDPRQSLPTNQEKVSGNVSEKILPQRYMSGGQQQSHLHGSANFSSGTFVPNLVHTPALMHAQHAAGHRHHHRGNFPHCYPLLPHMLAGTPHLNPNPFPTPCRITLIVGTEKFVGVGRTIQLAKHDAAAQAIDALKELVDNQQKEITDEKSSELDNKSPISLVFEIGIKRNLPVDFKILREDGPAHMRTFTTACVVGQIVTEAEGTGKKISKKKAAQKMLEELNKLPPVVTPVTSPTKRVKTKSAAPRKGAGSHGKQMNASENKESGNTSQRGGGGGESARDKHKKRPGDAETDSSNPITKLLELFQHNKEKEPVFKLITESGKERTRQRQFVVEVSSKDTTARGVGNSKKSARRNAAQNFLMSLGLVDKDAPISSETTGEPTSDQSCHEKVAETKIVAIASDRKVDSKKEHSDVSASAGTVGKELPKDQSNLACAKDTPKSVDKSSVTTQSSTSTTAVGATTTTTPATKPAGLYMKDKLLYLARLMGFEVDFSDYPKGNHNEFLSIVMISTNPPQICHGIGANAIESQEDAASNALKILSEMGLNK